MTTVLGPIKLVTTLPSLIKLVTTSRSNLWPSDQTCDHCAGPDQTCDHCAGFDQLVTTVPGLIKLVTTVLNWSELWPMCCTAKTQYRKFEINIPREGIARPESQFPHSCVCKLFQYSTDLSANSAAEKYVDRSREYINRSQTHECGNWDCVPAIPFLGIHKWDFRCSVSLNKPR